MPDIRLKGKNGMGAWVGAGGKVLSLEFNGLQPKGCCWQHANKNRGSLTAGNDNLWRLQCLRWFWKMQN